MHLGVWRADAGATSHALRAQRVGPRQIEMHDDAGVLEIHSFREEIGGKQQTNGVVRRRRRAFLRERREPGECLAPADAATGNAGVLAGEQADAGDVRQRAVQGTDGLRELREGDDGCVGVRVEHSAKGVSPGTVASRGLCMVFGQSRQRLEMRL